MNASEYRDEAIRRLDVLAFMAAQGVELLATVGKDERRFRCPFHVDNEASANINTESGRPRRRTRATRPPASGARRAPLAEPDVVATVAAWHEA
jgi:hypothetical protein